MLEGVSGAGPGLCSIPQSLNKNGVTTARWALAIASFPRKIWHYFQVLIFKIIHSIVAPFSRRAAEFFETLASNKKLELSLLTPQVESVSSSGLGETSLLADKLPKADPTSPLLENSEVAEAEPEDAKKRAKVVHDLNEQLLMHGYKIEVLQKSGR